MGVKEQQTCPKILEGAFLFALESAGEKRVLCDLGIIEPRCCFPERELEI